MFVWKDENKLKDDGMAHLKNEWNGAIISQFNRYFTCHLFVNKYENKKRPGLTQDRTIVSVCSSSRITDCAFESAGDIWREQPDQNF